MKKCHRLFHSSLLLSLVENSLDLLRFQGEFLRLLHSNMDFSQLGPSGKNYNAVTIEEKFTLLIIDIFNPKKSIDIRVKSQESYILE